MKALSLCWTALVLSGCVTSQSLQSHATAAEPPFAAKIREFTDSDRAAQPPRCQILFVGSSSIARWKTLATDMAPLPVINRGLGGSQISEVNYWFDTLVAPYHPRAIVFYAGENDIAAGKSPHQVVSDFEDFLGRKSQTLGDTPVYFISLKPSKLRFDQLAQQTQVNTAIKYLADSRADLHYIDVVPLMLKHGTPRDLFMPDNLHMRPEGYQLWTEAVRAAILPNTEREAQQCRQMRRHPGPSRPGT